jgi:hypothetical protein
VRLLHLCAIRRQAIPGFREGWETDWRKMGIFDLEFTVRGRGSGIVDQVQFRVVGVFSRRSGAEKIRRKL